MFLSLARKISQLKMQHIAGLSRQQLQICSLEDKIALDSPLRFIKTFVEFISLEALGFTAQKKRTLNPLDILKISRELQKC